MSNFLRRLNQVNPLLFRFGWVMWVGAFVSLVLTSLVKTEVLGINAWIKPLKFFISVAIMTWTLGYITQWLNNRKAVHIYSISLVITLSLELLLISFQAARGERSHFNQGTAFNSVVYLIMGLAILVFTLWTAYICFLYFRQKEFAIPPALVWGIRMGLLLFVVFASEAVFMLKILAHTVGGMDGGGGLPLVNWSVDHGDLRVSHFFGMHALQVLPLYAYYMAKSKREMIIVSVIYLLAAVSLLIMALKGIPLIRV